MAFVKLNHGEEIHYRLLPGAKDRPYLVFLHEGLGCIQMWRDFPDRLCRAVGCPGLIYDRSGFGESSAPTRPRTLHYLHDGALVELFGVIRCLIPDRPYFLVGHSDGASIALIHAAERPEQLGGVIAEAPHVMVEPETLEGIRQTVASFGERKRKALSRYHGERAETVFRAWHEIWLDRAFSHWNIEYVLPSVRCPCLILHGKQDPYGTQRHAALIASSLSGHVQLEMIAHCGHTPHLESAATSLELMTGFIQSILDPTNPVDKLDRKHV